MCSPVPRCECGKKCEAGSATDRGKACARAGGTTTPFENVGRWKGQVDVIYAVRDRRGVPWFGQRRRHAIVSTVIPKHEVLISETDVRPIVRRRSIAAVATTFETMSVTTRSAQGRNTSMNVQCGSRRCGRTTVRGYRGFSDLIAGVVEERWQVFGHQRRVWAGGGSG